MREKEVVYRYDLIFLKKNQKNQKIKKNSLLVPPIGFPNRKIPKIT